MRSLLVNTYDERGGAARAAIRLLRGLRELGIDASLLVQRRFGREPGVLGPRGRLARAFALLRPRLESLPVRAYPRRQHSLFSPAVWPSDTLRRIVDHRPDVVHLHWVGFGFLRPEALARLPVPTVWTLHDSWAFTGGCHLPGDCTRYRGSCGACPCLGSTREHDLSRAVFGRKQRAYAERRLTFVAPSRWLADAARSSTLVGGARVEVIPNGVDLRCFAPRDRLAAREALGLPLDRSIVLFSALEGLGDRNKAFHLLAAALTHLSGEAWRGRILLVVIGEAEPPGTLSLPVDVRFLGHLDGDERVVQAMASSDVVAIPSLQESQSLMAVESMACGRPVVAFRATGVAEVVDHGRTGYLARPYQSEDLARGIQWVLNDAERRNGLGFEARARAEREYDARLVASRYRGLYDEIRRKR